jgi:hypothetical protein
MVAYFGRNGALHSLSGDPCYSKLVLNQSVHSLPRGVPDFANFVPASVQFRSGLDPKSNLIRRCNLGIYRPKCSFDFLDRTGFGQAEKGWMFGVEKERIAMIELAPFGFLVAFP